MSNVDFAALRQSGLAFWHQRNARERIALACAAAVMLAAVLYASVLSPVITSRDHLATGLPALRQQAAEMELLSKRAAQFTTNGAPQAPMPTRDAIETSLQAKGLKPQSVTVDGALARVQLTAVAFSSLLEWLDDAQRSTRLVVVDATIAAQPAADTVNATLTLQQQKSE